jgi:hypothetical protein
MEYLGRLIYTFALFLKNNKASVAKQEVTSLFQEAKGIFYNLGKEDLVKKVEEKEKSESQ